MKNVLVTGATSEVGQAICKRLASNNNIIIHYHTKKEEAFRLKEELEKKYNNKCICIEADLTKEKDINNLMDIAFNEMKTIDILINNAALDKPNIFDLKEKEDFCEILDVNLIAPFLLSKRIGKEMSNNKFGKIINIASTNGIDTYYPMCLDYDASKAGLISLTHNLALQFKPYVNVNAIAPGWIKTEKDISDLSEDYIKEEEEKIFKNRFGEVDEIAYLVEFLVSDKADYINNQVIRIDGGMY